MLKVLLCVVVVICATMVGNWFSIKISQRTKDLFTVVEILVKLKNYIAFDKSEIHRVVKESFASAYGFDDFGEVCDDLSFREWWNKSVEKLTFTTALNKEDLSLLLRFGEKLGVTDVDGQISNCDLYIKLFSERLENAKESENKNVRLYRVLGFSAGCTVSLVLL